MTELIKKRVALRVAAIVVMLLGNYSLAESVEYNFKDASSLLPWTFTGIENPTIENEALYAQSVSSEPKMEVAFPRAITALDYSHFAVMMKAQIRTTVDYTTGRMYWQRTEDEGFSDERCVVFALPNKSEFVRIEIPLSDALWQGEVTRVMFSPAGGVGSFWIKYIMLKEKPPGWTPEKAARFRFDFKDGTTQGWMPFGGIEDLSTSGGALAIHSAALGGASLYYYSTLPWRLWKVPYVRLRIAASRATQAEFRFFSRGLMQLSVPFQIRRSQSTRTYYYIKLREWYDPNLLYDSVLLSLDERHTGGDFRIESIEFLGEAPLEVVFPAAWQKFFAFDEIRPVRMFIKLALIGLVISALVFCGRLIVRQEIFRWAKFERHMRRSGSGIILGIWFFLGLLYVVEEWNQFWEDRRYLGGLDELGRASVILSDIQQASREAVDADFLRFATYCRENIPPLTPVWLMTPQKSGLHGFATYYFYPLVLYDPATDEGKRDYLIAYKQSAEEIEKYAPQDQFSVYRKPAEYAVILKRKRR